MLDAARTLPRSFRDSWAPLERQAEEKQAASRAQDDEAAGPPGQQFGPWAQGERAAGSGDVQVAPVAARGPSQAASARPCAPLHKRSVSQIEPTQADWWPAPLATCALGAPGWPANWSGGAHVPDWAAMSFGPPTGYWQPPVQQPACSWAWPGAGPARAAEAPHRAGHLFAGTPIGKRNSSARSTLPMTAQPSVGPTILAPPYNPAHDGAPAASGGARRAPGACPAYCPLYGGAPTNNDDPVTENACLGSYKRKRRRPHIEAQFTITKAPELAAGSGGADPERREREALQSGRLFVRDAQPSPRPPGLPQPGQRSEQRRLRGGRPLVAQVEQMGAREKIETYLRDYERNSARAQSPGSPAPSLVELHQLDELTFQPYYNLPQLKYTIRLPVRRRPDGSLLFEATSHLRPGRARPQRAEGARGPARPAKRRLGSSSSCPAPLGLGSGGGGAYEDAHPLRAQAGADRRSLESALELPTVANRPVGVAGGAPDSLEGAPGGSGASGRGLGAPSPPPESDYASVCEPRPEGEGVAMAGPPPPVPPHRRVGRAQPVPGLAGADTTDAWRQEPRAGAHATVPDAPEPPAGPQEPANGTQWSASSLSSSCGSSQDAEPSSATDNGPGAASESLANDQSVDENYEFDQVSSCSSSTQRLAARHGRAGRHRWAWRRHGARATAANRPAADGRSPAPRGAPIYSQVDKRKKPGARGEPGAHVARHNVVVVERTLYYDCSRRKQQLLAGAGTLAPGAYRDPAPGSHYYDTVYDALASQTRGPEP